MPNDTGGYQGLISKDGEAMVAHVKASSQHVGHFALKPNTYDAVTWALVKMNDPSMQQHKGSCHLKVGFIIPCVLNFITILLQVGAIFGLLQFTVARAHDHYTTGTEGQSATRAIILNAIETNVDLDPEKHKHIIDMCKYDHNVPYSQSVMTWLWGMKLLPILSQGIWVMVLVMRMPRAGAGEDWVATNSKDKNLDIVKMGLCSKIYIVLFVDLPRVAVAVYLYWMGANFLMYASSLGVLIMKSIGLGFISLLPDVIFAGSFSEAFQKEIASVKLAFVEEDEDKEHGPCGGCMENWNLWGASFVKVFGVLLISLYYCRIICGDLQNLREACIEWKYHFILPKCPECGSHFFGLTLYN